MRNRKAGEKLKEVLTPWLYSDLPDAGNWKNNTEAEWISHTNKMRDAIAYKLGNYRNMTDSQIQNNFDNIAGYLIEKEGFTTKGAEEAINKLMKKRNPKTGLLTELDYGTAHTNADEQLARLTLELNGFANPRFNNKDNVFATDFTAETTNGLIGIDAQSTFRRNKALSMPVATNLVDAGAAWNNNPDRPFIDIMNEAREIARSKGIQSAGSEMKLLETSNPDYNPIDLASEEFKTSNPDSIDKLKDYLMINHRSGQVSPLMEQVQRDHGRKHPKPKGPYDPTLPNDMDLVPMEALRAKLFEMTPRQMEKSGIRLDEGRMSRARNRELDLVLPQRVIKGLKDPMGRDLSSDMKEFILRYGQ